MLQPSEVHGYTLPFFSIVSWPCLLPSASCPLPPPFYPDPHLSPHNPAPTPCPRRSSLWMSLRVAPCQAGVGLRGCIRQWRPRRSSRFRLSPSHSLACLTRPSSGVLVCLKGAGCLFGTVWGGGFECRCEHLQEGRIKASSVTQHALFRCSWVECGNAAARCSTIPGLTGVQELCPWFHPFVQTIPSTLCRNFPKLAGMTGTAATEVSEFDGIYKLPVAVVPTNRIISRVDNPDVVFRCVWLCVWGGGQLLKGGGCSNTSVCSTRMYGKLWQ
jgi:hypothetical protein